jgi:hypothetical protein
MLGIEAATWGVNRLQQELAIRLPNGWAYTIDLIDSMWEVKIINLDQLKIWSSIGITAQIVLLDAIGWLESTVLVFTKHSPWNHSPKESQHYDVIFPKVTSDDDPLDLIPGEIDQIYLQSKK